MNDIKDDIKEVGFAQHDGDIRIYQVADTEIWLQSDVSVDEVLDTTDADPTYSPDVSATTPEDDTNE